MDGSWVGFPPESTSGIIWAAAARWTQIPWGRGCELSTQIKVPPERPLAFIFKPESNGLICESFLEHCVISIGICFPQQQPLSFSILIHPFLASFPSCTTSIACRPQRDIIKETVPFVARSHPLCPPFCLSFLAYLSSSIVSSGGQFLPLSLNSRVRPSN